MVPESCGLIPGTRTCRVTVAVTSVNRPPRTYTVLSTPRTMLCRTGPGAAAGTAQTGRTASIEGAG